MRLALLLAASALALTLGVASAQSWRWTDPTGSWSIDFRASGWGLADGLGPNGPLLLIAPMAAPPDSEIRICLAEQTAAPQSAETVETDIAEASTSSATRLFPRAQLQNARVEALNIRGRPVAAVRGMSRNNEFRGRAFVTRAQDQVLMTTISCILTPGMNAERAAEVDAILQTLEFDSANGTP